MMRFFFGLIAVLFIFQLTVTRAQALGQQCCPAGKVFNDGQCMTDAKEICRRTAEPVCGVLTGADIIRDFPVMEDACADVGTYLCSRPAVVSADVAQGSTKFCPVLVNSMVGTIPGAAALPPAVKLAATNACIAFWNVNLAGEQILSDAACAADETCVQNVCYVPGTYFLCNQATPQYKPKCESCLKTGGIWTAIGCVEHTAQGITDNLLKVGLGIAGGLALLMILVAAFEFSVSQGDPKLTNEAKERLQAAVIGLLFIIFSVTILQFMGVTILHIPGFGV